ncbi:MAG TPA: SusC/RagA family TonB-linked outer membrane protein, partial [Paludibacter sp.]
MNMKIDKYILDMNRMLSGIRYLGTLFLIVMFLSAQGVQAQGSPAKIVVKGLVRDAHSKKPVIAAQISILNSKKTTSTDDKGTFSIEVPSLQTLLHVGAYDYNVREYPIQGKDSVVINLYPEVFSNYYKNIEGLNGVVDNSTSVNSVVGISEKNQSHAFTADEALQTEAGGDVRAISRSAVTGEGASLFIRGLNSLNANAQPLFVVDGVIWNSLYDVTSIHQGFSLNPLCNIESNDIASITVMKDGTSLYGSKGANGVVLIKTKRGTGMATKINLNIVTGITTAPNTIPVMGVNDYKTYVTEMLGSSGLSNNEISQLPYLNDNQARSTYKIYHNNTDWPHEIYRTAVNKTYSINVQGGDDKAIYYFSLGYTGNDGVVKTTNFQRYNMRLNADVKLAEIVNLGLNVGFARIDRKLVDDGVNNYTSPTWLSLVKSPFLSPNTFTFMGERTTEYAYTDVFGIGNPPAIINFSNNTVKQNNFNVGLKPEVKITPDMTLSENFDYSLNKVNEDSYRPYLYSTPIFIQGIGYSYNSRQSQVLRNNSVFSDTRLTYKKKLDDKTLIDAFIGTRYLVNNFESDFVEGHNSLSNSSINLVGGFKNLYTTGVNDMTKSLSHYVSVDLNTDNRFMLNLTTSMDASSRFGNETKGGISIFGHSFGVFPSANAAWLASSEKFMKYVPAINLLKFRAGVGITGNDDIKDYQTLAYFSSVRLKGVANGMVISGLANPTIEWETTARLNFGMDLGLLNERLLLSVDLFSAATGNLLVLKQYQDISGLNSYWTNSGMLGNKGAEVSLNAKVLNLKDFHWELGMSAGHYVNTILELPNGSYTTKVYDGEVLTAVGNSAGVFYGYKTNGVFASEAAATAANLRLQNSNGSFSAFGAGDVIFEDKNGDGIIDENDKQVIGNPNPVLYGTFTNKFSYKNFLLTALFTYSYGNDVYNYQRSQLESGKDFGNQTTAMVTRWTSENQITKQPKALYGDPMGNSRFSDRWIEDGSYIRMKSLTLSYSLPI